MKAVGTLAKRQSMLHATTTINVTEGQGLLHAAAAAALTEGQRLLEAAATGALAEGQGHLKAIAAFTRGLGRAGAAGSVHPTACTRQTGDDL